MEAEAAGHRTVPHTADLRVEAWAPTREQCIAEAVVATVASFVDTTGAHPTTTYRCRLAAPSDEDLLVAVLDELVYRLDTAGEVPVDIELDPFDDSLDVSLAMVDATTLPRTGAIPKAVSLHELRCAVGPQGWTCSVTLDV